MRKRLAAAGAEAVKAEGGPDIAEQVRAIVASGIPFLGHLGMLPQHVLEEGGYHVKGKTEPEHQASAGGRPGAGKRLAPSPSCSNWSPRASPRS